MRATSRLTSFLIAYNHFRTLDEDTFFPEEPSDADAAANRKMGSDQ